MTNNVRPTIAILCAAALAACSPGSGTTPPATMAANRAQPAGKGRLVLHVRVPKKNTAQRAAPRYISVATKGMTMAFTGASTFKQVINLTPSDPRCKGSPLVCTIALDITAGKYTADIVAYDRAPVNGAIPAGAHPLSSANSLALSVIRGETNGFGITLDGIPASILVDGLPSAIAGTGFLFKDFTVTLKDADGYAIVGTYATPVALTDDDTTGATAIATSGNDNPPARELLSSSDTPTISYTGLLIAPVTIAASAGAIAGSAIFAVQQPVFVADTGNNAVKEIPPGCEATYCITTLGGGFSTPYGVAVDVSGNVFVADFGDNAVKEIPFGCFAAGCVTTLGGGFTFPTGVAIDGSGNVFVADYGDSAVKKIPSGCMASGCVTTLGAGFSNPFGVAVRSGSVFVSDGGHNAVKEIPPGCLAVGCVATLGGGFSGPSGIAVDGSGNVIVGDSGHNAVKKIPLGCATAGCVITLGGGFATPFGVAIDVSGDVFVADNGNSAVKKIPPGCLTPGCVTIYGVGFLDPFSVGVF